jgi:hypothetical protein
MTHPDQYRYIARRVWTKLFGPIPPGHEIHHRDNDDINNDPSNLQLMSYAEHRAWHIANSPHKTIVCEQCGCDIDQPWPYYRQRFCSNACKSKHRRASRVDHEERICSVCGKPFQCNKYAKQHRCSHECAGRGKYVRLKKTR